jgi:hypothetical protein
VVQGALATVTTGVGALHKPRPEGPPDDERTVVSYRTSLGNSVLAAQKGVASPRDALDFGVGVPVVLSPGHLLPSANIRQASAVA